MARARHAHFVWLAFDTNRRFFDLKINFLFEFVSSSSWLLIISRVRNIIYGVSPLIQNEGYWLWNQIFLWNVSSASRSLIVARDSHGHFEWLAFDTDQRFAKIKDTLVKSVAKFSGLFLFSLSFQCIWRRVSDLFYLLFTWF